MIHSDPSKAAHSSFLLASINAANSHQPPHKHAPDGSMERASLLGTNADQVYCQQKRQPPSGGSGHDMSKPLDWPLLFPMSTALSVVQARRRRCTRRPRHRTTVTVCRITCWRRRAS